MAQNLQQLLDARNNAESTYNEMLQDPENALDAYPEGLTPDQQENRQYEISQGLYAANQAFINAARAYANAIQTDNNATPEDKQQARDYANHIDVLPQPQRPETDGGRRRRSSTPRKSSSSRRRRSTKRRTASRKQQKRRRGSRRAH